MTYPITYNKEWRDILQKAVCSWDNPKKVKEILDACPEFAKIMENKKFYDLYPCMLANAWKNPTIIRLFLDHGADPTRGLEMAFGCYGNELIFKMLIEEYGASKNKAMVLVMFPQYIPDLVEYLLEMGTTSPNKDNGQKWGLLKTIQAYIYDGYTEYTKNKIIKIIILLIERDLEPFNILSNPNKLVRNLFENRDILTVEYVKKQIEEYIIYINN